MASYPIRNYYVGRLNFTHEAGKPHDSNIEYLKAKTILRGAISCNWASLCDLTDYDKGIEYDSVFTVFYRNEDDTYYCLHNDNLYRTQGDIFVSDTVPFLEVCPTVGSIFWTSDNLSATFVRTFFNALFKPNTSSLYNSDKYQADNFYFGDLKLYVGKTDKRETPNIAQRMLLSGYKLQPYKIEKEIDPKTQEELQYRLYKVIALWVNAYRMYNINEHRQTGQYELANDGTVLTTTHQLIDEPYFKDRTWSDNCSIQHMLKLQRRFNKKNK